VVSINAKCEGVVAAGKGNFRGWEAPSIGVCKHRRKCTAEYRRKSGKIEKGVNVKKLLV